MFRSTKWRHTEECGAARPTGARHAGSDGLKRLVGAAMNADTRPGARPLTPLAAAMLFPSSWTRPPIQAGRPGLNHGERADAGGFQGVGTIGSALGVLVCHRSDEGGDSINCT